MTNHTNDIHSYIDEALDAITGTLSQPIVIKGRELTIQKIDATDYDENREVNRWETRQEVGNLEWGILPDESPLEVIADTHETGFFTMLDQAQRGPDLFKVTTFQFDNIDKAVEFAASATIQFDKDHTSELMYRPESSKLFTDAIVAKTALKLEKSIASKIVSAKQYYNESGEITHFILRYCRAFEAISGTESSQFTIRILESELNWSHSKLQATARDNHVKKALHFIRKSDTRKDLMHLAGIAKRYSRDMQLLNDSTTFDGGFKTGRKVSIGFNYTRYAYVMNAIASRAADLGLEGFKTYTINEFNNNRNPTDGDALDVGCRVGAFLALEAVAETGPSLWEYKERTFKPSLEAAINLHKAGPTGYIAKPWFVIADEAIAWQSGSASKAA